MMKPEENLLDEEKRKHVKEYTCKIQEVWHETKIEYLRGRKER